MRLVVLITLMISMTVAPAAALRSCASMASSGHMMAGEPVTDSEAGHGGMAMGMTDGEDCDMSAAMGGAANGGAPGEPSHDAGCAAACGLVCPGFYAGSEKFFANTPAFELAEYSIPTMGPGVATLSHLDPPPPRI